MEIDRDADIRRVYLHEAIYVMHISTLYVRCMVVEKWLLSKRKNWLFVLMRKKS